LNLDRVFYIDKRITFEYDWALCWEREMKSISSIKWTEDRINHIAIHSITPQEVEEACFNEDDPPLIRTGRDNLHYVFGKTISGRALFVVVRFVRPGEVRLVTARDMNDWERKYYKKRGK
jgi:uncharacterized DUF497 family protein